MYSEINILDGQNTHTHMQVDDIAAVVNVATGHRKITLGRKDKQPVTMFS